MRILLILILVSVFVSSTSLSYAEEITPKYPIMKNFPYDSQKGVEYYLERYYSESVYKTWFHKNFSGTIEEALGLTPSYSEMFSKIHLCILRAENTVFDYYENTGDTSSNYDMYMDTKNRCIGNTGDRDFNDAGVLLAELEFHKEAIALYDKAISLNDRYAIAYTNKATSLFELGEFEESEKMFDRALMLDPQNKEIIMLSETIKNKIEQESKKGNTIQTTPTGIICGTGTIYKDGQCVVDSNYKPNEKSSKGGGCLIATATYGSELAPQVQQLRELRDNHLLQTESGTTFMNTFNEFYYSFSPIIADLERENPIFKEMVKIAITPMITSLSILNYVDIDSEESVLGYGISLILLNIGMYLGIPVVGVIGIKRKITQYLLDRNR